MRMETTPTNRGAQSRGAGAADAVLAQVVTLVQAAVSSSVVVVSSSRFDTELDLDSLQVMDLVATLEDHFDIVIPLNDLPAMQDVAQTAARIAQLVDRRGR